MSQELLLITQRFWKDLEEEELIRWNGTGISYWNRSIS
jgi:hypothetical protein